MWESSLDSESLALILHSCVVLALASVLIWAACFLVRARRLIRAERVAETRERLTSRLLAEITEPAAGPVSYANLSRLERWVLLQVLQEMANQITGAEKARLVKLIEREGLVDVMRQVLRSGWPAERQAACALLAHSPRPEAAADLRTALLDRDLGVRVTAARSLLGRNEVTSLRELLAAVRLPPNDPPLALSDLLARLPGSLHEEAVELLRGPLPNEWKRIFAIALGRLQAEDLLPALAALARHASDGVRAAAWIGLRELGSPAAAELLRHGLTDPSTSVRQAACQCAALLGRPEHLPRLLAIVREDEWWVSHAAAVALWEFGPRGRALLRWHAESAPELAAGVQVLRERELEDLRES